MKSNLKRTGFIFACVAPAVILFVIFMAVPTFNVFRLSLYQRSTFNPNEVFIGMKNFQMLMKDANFIRSMQNMLLLIVMVTVFTMATALIFAGILTREKLKGQDFFRIVFYIPNILSVVVISGIFSAIYDIDRGLLNSILNLFGKEGILWKGEEHVIMSLVIAMVWQAIGYYMVMYMSSMSSIPENLYEAASLEGASKVRQFFMITLPLIWDNIRTTLTFFVISTINLSFMFVQLTSEGNLGSEVALNYMYNNAFAGKYGFGMAVGVCIFVFSFALSAIINKVTERDVLQY